MIRNNYKNKVKFEHIELHNAVIDGNTAKVRELLQLGWDVNAQDKEGMAPLHFST